MKPTPIFVAAAGFAMIGACTVKTEDNAADSVDTNTAVAPSENNAPAPESTAGSDTLGNQLNQLNQSGTEVENSAE
jgi:hypothetical protein